MKDKELQFALGELVENIGDAIHQFGYRLQKSSGLLKADPDLDEVIPDQSEQNELLAQMAKKATEAMAAEQPPEEKPKRKYLRRSEKRVILMTLAQPFSVPDLAKALGQSKAAAERTIDELEEIVEITDEAERERLTAKYQEETGHFGGRTMRWFRFNPEVGKPEVEASPSAPRPERVERGEAVGTNGASKDMRDIIKLAVDQGWSVSKTGGDHLKFVPKDPSKKFVITSQTPSDHRALRNAKEDLRKQGLKGV